jgi:N-acetyl-gamma-glutamyl-phosphate reductase
MKKIAIGIVGGTGYTGVELLRLLLKHPAANVVCVTSRGDAGVAVAEVFPNLRGFCDLKFEHPDAANLSACDVVFFATPNGIAMKEAPPLLEKGVRVIDLSADFRLKNIQEWEKWYGMTHQSPAWVARAVYGLPELSREAIRGAQLIANPGCYPTAVQLGLAPLIEAGLIDTQTLIADCKSGVSGAGRKAEIPLLLTESSENFKAYGVQGHRHLPEIKQELSRLSNESMGLTFVPHLVPMVRGMYATLYATLSAQGLAATNLQALYEARYANEAFVDVLPAGQLPETRSVKGANTCRIAIQRPQGGNCVVILSAIDNLTKGAAGQAVQNMNLLFDLPETTGLEGVPLMP